MRTLILKMSFDSTIDMPGTMTATFDDCDGNVSTEEAVQGIAFGSALLFKNKIAQHMDKEKFIRMMSAYIEASIESCTVLPDARDWN